MGRIKANTEKTALTKPPAKEVNEIAEMPQPDAESAETAAPIGYQPAKVHFKGKEIIIMVPTLPGKRWTLTPELAGFLAKSNCKRCYGRGFEGYYMPPPGEATPYPPIPLTCRQRGCTDDNFEMLKKKAVKGLAVISNS